MYGDVKGGGRYGDLAGCQWLLPPLSVAPSSSDTAEPVFSAFLKETDVFGMCSQKRVLLIFVKSPNQSLLRFIFTCIGSAPCGECEMCSE